MEVPEGEHAMSATLTIPPELEALIREKVESGKYSSPNDVVREALKALDERDKLHRLREMIADADAQIARGEGIPWTPETMDRLRREADENVRAGKPIKDEIKP
jgi:antitoxin ParD1/3/4